MKPHKSHMRPVSARGQFRPNGPKAISYHSTQFLKDVPYFSGLSLTSREVLAARCKPKALRAGQFVFLEGDPCSALYIVESGKVKCYRASADGREQTMKVFDQPGDTFCVASAFQAGHHIVTAQAMTDTRLHALDVDTIKHVVRGHPSVALSLVAAAGDQMKSLVELAEGLSLKTAPSRLAKFLYELARTEGVRKGTEIQLHRDRHSEEELASMIGTVRVHISRSLKNLVSAGAIRLDRKVIRIPDLNILEQLSRENSRTR